MRKLFALAMVAALSIAVAFAAVSCGKKAEESTPMPESAAPTQSSMPDTGAAAADTGMSHMDQDTSMHQ